MSHSLRRDLVCAYTIWYYDQILISCTIPGESCSTPSRIHLRTRYALVWCIRLLCDYLSPLCLHIAYICYSVMCYQFLLWYNLLLWHYFLLLSKYIQFESWSFLPLSYIHVIPCEILTVFHLKYQYSWFSSHFYFIVVIVYHFHPCVAIAVTPAVISLSLLFLM